MEEKLRKLFIECKDELSSIGIDINNKLVGNIDINIAKRNCKRYGCCKQEVPDVSTRYYEKVGRRRYARYAVYKKHTIEISKWVMELNSDIIKNTIMHEIIHCFPNCNNHGEDFKKYANYINKNLGYNISRLGDKNQDLKNSNVETVKEHYNYQVKCSDCGYTFYRKRITNGFSYKYRCGKCRGKFIVEKGKFYC